METWTKTRGPDPGGLILTHTHMDPREKNRWPVQDRIHQLVEEARGGIQDLPAEAHRAPQDAAQHVAPPLANPGWWRQKRRESRAFPDMGFGGGDAS